MNFDVKTVNPGKDILYTLDDYSAITVNVASEGIEAGDDGRKIVPAGTVIGGVLEDMSEAAVPAEGGSGEGAVAAEGILLHDVDVTSGNALGTMVVRGIIDGKKLPEAITDDQKATLPMIVVVGSPE